MRSNIAASKTQNVYIYRGVNIRATNLMSTISDIAAHRQIIKYHQNYHLITSIRPTIHVL